MTAASLQREREYMDWQEKCLGPGYEWRNRHHLDDSKEAFMFRRRDERERARLRKVCAKRTQKRREERPELAAAALEREQAFADWLTLSADDGDECDETRQSLLAERDETYYAFMEQWREQQLKKHNETRRKGTKCGRPVDPASKRQQQLAARQLRRQHKAQAKLESQLRRSRGDWLIG